MVAVLFSQILEVSILRMNFSRLPKDSLNKRKLTCLSYKQKWDLCIINPVSVVMQTFVKVFRFSCVFSYL